MTASEEIAQWACSVKHVDRERRQLVTNLVLDYLACGLLGARTVAGRVVREFVCSMGGAEEAVVLGAGSLVPAPMAAFANGFMAHTLDYDDVDPQSLFHTACSVVPAVLACGEALGVSGGCVMLGALVGAEVLARLAYALNPAMRQRGFHTTSVCGSIASAVACSKVFGLGPDETKHAIALGAAQAGGLMEFYGATEQKGLGPGAAARNGVMAACLAARGLRGSSTVLEGSRGLGAAFADGIDLNTLLHGLGQEWLARPEFKPYSCSRGLHSMVECILELRSRGITTDDVERIVVYRNPYWAGFHSHLVTERSFRAYHFSLPHIAGTAFCYGRVDPEAIASAVGDDRVARVATKVESKVDGELRSRVACRVKVVMADGRVLEVSHPDPLGGMTSPGVEELLAKKLSRALDGIPGEVEMADLRDRVAKLWDGGSIRVLTGLLLSCRVPSESVGLEDCMPRGWCISDSDEVGRDTSGFHGR